MEHRENKSETGKILRAFGARIRYLRLKVGHSQETLAEICGLDRTYIGGIERGERNPSLKNIARLARALGVSVATLFDETESDLLQRKTR